jgi:hypothetical protein
MCTTISRSGDDLTVVTPRRRTSSGSRGSAIATGSAEHLRLVESVPSLKVIVSAIWPSVVLCDDM